MLILPLEEAQPGMTLVMTVTHPENPEQELLKPGFILDAAVLAKLRSLGVPFLYIDYPDLADLDKALLPHLSPARQTVYNQVKRTIAAVQKTDRPSVSFPDYYVATRELVLTLLQQGEHPVYLDILSATGADAITHATTVAHLSVTLGLRMESYLIQQRSRLAPRHAREVVNLGVAGMLHDIGKAKLPPTLREHDAARLPPEPDATTEWQSHPVISADMVRHGIEPSAVAAIAQHHQHFDGTGFPAVARSNLAPAPLRAEAIHIFGRILLVADLYDRLATPPGLGRRRLPIEVLHLLRTEYASWLDPHILSCLPTVIPPLPPGSRVTLSDATQAVVTTTDPKYPYCPTVRRLAAATLKGVGNPFRLDAAANVHITSVAGVRVEAMIRAALDEPSPAQPGPSNKIPSAA